MIQLKTRAEIEAMARAGAILGQVLDMVGAHVEPGVSSGRLDALAEEFIRAHDGATPAFKGLYGFPASLCVSINDEVVHGIPSPKRVLREGDIVSIDVGVLLDGWYTDGAVTRPVGEIDPESARLLEVTRRAIAAGIAVATPRHRTGDIGAAVQAVAEQAGFSVVRDLVGHGLGRGPHEEPQIPNYGTAGKGVRLRAGMVIAIEPMINVGGPEVRTLTDRWTVVTVDGSRSAHFEHTVAITASGPQVLTGPGVPVRP